MNFGSKMSEKEPNVGSSQSKQKKRVDLNAYRERFRNLHMKREEGRKLNHDQVVEEDRVSKLPHNFEAKRRRQEWELEEMEGRELAEELGEDYDRQKNLNIQADIAEKIQAAKKRKKRPDTDTGVSIYEQMSIRQYERLTNGYKPDMETYQKMKAVVGEEGFYPSVNTLIQGSHYPTQAAMEKLTKDLESQKERRDKFHRRRTFDPDAAIDYINEKNRKFNVKLEKFYGDYTKDLKDDLERGTAI